MDNKRLDNQRKKNPHHHKIKDVIPKVSSDDSPLNKALDSFLQVRKVAILPKHSSLPGLSTKLLPECNKHSLSDTSSNESFISTRSVACMSSDNADCSKLPPTIGELELMEVPTDNQSAALHLQNINNDELMDTKYYSTEGSSLKVNIDSSPQDEVQVNDETLLPSYDEEYVEVPSFTQNCDISIENILANEIIKSTVDEETLYLLNSEGNLKDISDLVTSAVASQAIIETLTEDSDAQIQSLLRIRDLELKTNQCLRTRVVEMEEKMHSLVGNVESSYAETYGELAANHEKELEVMRLECAQKMVELENQVRQLTDKLILTEKKLIEKEEVERVLKNNVNKLEETLREKEKHCREELEVVLAKAMQCDVVSTAKAEIEQEIIGNSEKECRDSMSDSIESISQALVSHALLTSEREELQEVTSQHYQEFDRAAMVADLQRASFLLNSQSKKSSENTKPLYEEVHFSPKKQKIEHVASDTLENISVNQFDQLRERNAVYQSEILKLSTKIKEDEQYLRQIVEERNHLQIENQKLKQYNQSQELQLSQFKVTNYKLEAEVAELIVVQDNLSTEMTELNTVTENLRKENNKLEQLVNENLGEKERRLNLEKELKKLKGTLELSTTRYQSLGANTSSLIRMLNELRANKSTAQSEYQDNFDWSLLSDCTQYLDYVPAPPVDVACQATTILTESACQTESDDSRNPNLEEDLLTSWTERCEVEQQLAAAFAENDYLRDRSAQLEGASRRAVGLVEAGFPSVAVWLQLRSCVREIVTELMVLKGTQAAMEHDCSVLSHSSSEQKLPIILESESNNLIGGRGSPEGGRESPHLSDGNPAIRAGACLNVNASDAEDGELVDTFIQTDDFVLDQNSSALLDMVQGLLRCLGGEDENCTLNGSLSTTLGDRLSLMPDAGDLCRCLGQVKEEVARLFALSRRSDPVIAKLQDEVRSLEHQVSASDKQVRSTRAFLEEQASEREQERDEAARQILELTETLRTRERQLAAKKHLEQDIEQLIQQLAEAQNRIDDEIEKREASERTLEQAMQKVKTLRDVLETLESQLAESNEQLEIVRTDNGKLLERLCQLGQDSLERESAQRDSFSGTLAYVARLEEELTSLQHRFLAIGPDSLVAARTSLHELEAAVALRTRNLELAQVAWNRGLSSASEELSTRDQVDATRCATPDEMLGEEAGVGLCEDVERLRERLLKHARVEEAALKRIKELEQSSLKVEELQVDLEVAMRRVDSLLIENETLKTRLEVERPRAPNSQAVIELESKVRQLEKELEASEEAVKAEKSQFHEKCRREERLQETLQTREHELRQESEIVKKIKEQLEDERSLRLAAEGRLKEVSKEVEEGAREILRLSNSNRSGDPSLGDSNISSSSASSSKRVRFNVPESFIGDSLTPISPGSAILLRDAPSCREEWVAFEQISRKPLPWENLRIGALQLSPRGNSSIICQSSLPEKFVEPNNTSKEKLFAEKCNDSQWQHKVEHDSQLRDELSSLKQKLEVTTRQLDTTREKYEEEVHSLEDQLADYKKQSDISNIEWEEERRRSEDAQKRASLQCKEALDKLEVQNSEIARLSALASHLEREKEKVFEQFSDLQIKIKMLTSNLEQQQKESNILNEKLKKAYEEIDTVKSINVQLSSQTTDDKVKLSNALRQLQLQQEEAIALKQLQQTTAEDLTHLKVVYEQLRAEDQVLRLQIAEKLEEINILQKQKLEDNVSDELKSKELEDNEGPEKQNQVMAKKCRMDSRPIPCSETSHHDTDRIRLEQLCVDAADRVSELRVCLESSMLRSASLEAELEVIKTCLASSETKVVQLELEVKQLRQHECEKEEAAASLSTNFALEKANSCLDHLAAQIQKDGSDLKISQRKQSELEKALKIAVDIGKESFLRENDLKTKLEAAERKILRLKYVVDTQEVSIRGLEKLHHHALAIHKRQCEPGNMKQHAVRSAGDGEERQIDWRWTVHRLESYRKALVWQKQFLQTSSGHRRPRRQQKPTLRIVTFMVVAILRMRYLVRRWKSRLPPLVSPYQRGQGQGRPLALSSPPCKDPGFRLKSIKQ